MYGLPPSPWQQGSNGAELCIYCTNSKRQVFIRFIVITVSYSLLNVSVFNWTREFLFLSFYQRFEVNFSHWILKLLFATLGPEVFGVLCLCLDMVWVTTMVSKLDTARSEWSQTLARNPLIQGSFLPTEIPNLNIYCFYWMLCGSKTYRNVWK